MTRGRPWTGYKHLRRRLVEWVNARPGRWLLGINVAVDVGMDMRRYGIHTSGEVLMKELRKAQRKGEIRKRINRLRMVEYTAVTGAIQCKP